MQRSVLIFSLLVISSLCFGQKIDHTEISPDSTTYTNVFVKPVYSDSLQSTYVIWVKDKVPPHYHNNHTEYIHVLSGKGDMTLGKKTFSIKKGDVVLIPEKTIHSVVTTSKKPLKVMSIQAPKFDGDRVWVD